MDFKKLSTFILLAGVAVFIYGLFLILANQPITTTPNTGNVFKDINQSIDNIGDNMFRQIHREDGKKKMLIGGVILFVGIAVRLSTKTSQSNIVASTAKGEPSNVPADTLTLRNKDSKQIRWLTITNSLVFICGFSVVFIILGASFSAAGQILFEYQDWIRIVGGILIIVFGLFIAGFVKLDFLMRDRKFHLRGKPTGYIGTFIVGMTFAAGWTPCIGPILGPILSYASMKGSTVYGLKLLAVYSLGLGLPFFIASLALNSFLSYSKTIRKHMKLIMVTSGLILIVFGVMLITNRLRELSGLLPGFEIKFGKELFERIPFIGAFVGGIISFLSPCVLPLFPSYVSFITGISFEDLTSSAEKGKG